jgi:acyl-coenzyme A thioesterase PaaI-like protein
MAALMKYVQLNHEEFNKLYKLNDAGGGDQPASTDGSKKDTPSSKSSPKTPEHQGSSSLDSDSKSRNTILVSRLEAYRGAYLALTPPDNFDTALYKAVEMVSGTTHPSGKSGTATFRVKFPAQYCNKFGTVHGGAIATLLDGLAQCSTAVVDGDRNEATMGLKKGKVRGGATRGLQVGYLRSIKVGEPVIIICEILKSSGTCTTIRETASREADGEILAVCAMEKERHEKAKL